MTTKHRFMHAIGAMAFFYILFALISAEFNPFLFPLPGRVFLAIIFFIIGLVFTVVEDWQYKDDFNDNSPLSQ